MADDVDVLLKLCEEQWNQCRHLEMQRSMVTNFVITIAAAILAFIAHKGFVPASLPLGGFMFFLGLYGAVVSEKIYERWQFTGNRALYWCRRINELRPDAECLYLQDIADKEYCHILQHLRLHWLWAALHLSISLLGLGSIIFILHRMS